MATYSVIGSTITVGSGNSSYLEFANIPSTYTDLIILFSGSTNRGNLQADGVAIRFNTDLTSGNYSAERLYSDGSGTMAQDQNNAGAGLTNSTGSGSTSSSIFGNSSIYIPNYAGSSEKKTFLADGASENNGGAYLNICGGMWNSTAAITNVRLYPETNATSWLQYTTATLYGIK